ncbi:hypothetical protein [Kribbella soli]|uniref:hypothetical protein n=1 Tax=Kribbella soli TaxID=1124743 RepID=UPI0013F47222|nr:hypothetical protein [Kribbella soli]
MSDANGLANGAADPDTRAAGDSDAVTACGTTDCPGHAVAPADPDARADGPLAR